MASAEQNLHNCKERTLNAASVNAMSVCKGNEALNAVSVNAKAVCEGNETLNAASVDAKAICKCSETLNAASVDAKAVCKCNETLNVAAVNAKAVCKGNETLNAAAVNAKAVCKGNETLNASLNALTICKGNDTHAASVNTVPKRKERKTLHINITSVNATSKSKESNKSDGKSSRRQISRPDTPIAPPFVPFVPNQLSRARHPLGYQERRRAFESHPRTLLLDAIALVEGEYDNTGAYLPELGANDQTSGAAPMFAGMRGMHGQMLPGSGLGGPSIPGLSGFGLSTSLPSLPPDRKVYSTPTPLPTLPSPDAGTPTTPTTSAYY